MGSEMGKKTVASESQQQHELTDGGYRRRQAHERTAGLSRARWKGNERRKMRKGEWLPL
jgi:hypothetical protein